MRMVSGLRNVSINSKVNPFTIERAEMCKR